MFENPEEMKNLLYPMQQAARGYKVLDPSVSQSVSTPHVPIKSHSTYILLTYTCMKIPRYIALLRKKIKKEHCTYIKSVIFYVL